MATEVEATDLARLLGRSMPTGPDTDKDLWLDDMTQVFQHYPLRDVEVMVKDPMSGIRSQQKWLPTILEVKEFLSVIEKRRGRILANARRLVEAHDNCAAEPEVSLEQRAAMGKRLAELAASMRATKILEPVAGKDPVDLDAQKRRRECLLEIERRKAARTPEEVVEAERILAWLILQREQKTA